MSKLSRTRSAITVICILALAGCAGGARVSNMVASVQPDALPLTELSTLFHSVRIEGVRGGESTNPLWISKVGNQEFEDALKQSLISHGIYSGEVGAGFLLMADLQALDQPFIGLDMTVTSTVHYLVRDEASGDHYFEQTINAPFTASIGDAFLGYERIRLANEGSIRENISKFIAALIAKDD
jgi:hypothetical protein